MVAILQCLVRGCGPFTANVRLHLKGNNMCRFVLLAIVLVLTGCSGIPYAPKGTTVYQGGFTDKRIAEKEYFVRFEGNGYNTMPQVVEFVRRRATELCGSSDFEASIREYISSHSATGYASGMVYPSQHRFPNAEAQIKCR